MPKDQLEMDGTSTEMSKACDKLLDSRDKLAKVKATYQEAEKSVIALMRSAYKKSIKHAGVTIRLSHEEEKDKIQVVSTD